MEGAAELAETSDYQAMSDSSETSQDGELVASGAEPVLVLRLNRPEARNALSRAIIGGIGDAVAEAETDPEIRAIVLTGTGDRAFCAGMDLRASPRAARARRRTTVATASCG